MTGKDILLGAVADDMTGATDLCNTLVPAACAPCK